jgi:hypothetical protein
LSGRSTTEKEQKQLLQKSIIGSGDADKVTPLEQMVLGCNQFSHLYVEVEININNNQNASSASAGVFDHHSQKKVKKCCGHHKCMTRDGRAASSPRKVLEGFGNLCKHA